MTIRGCAFAAVSLLLAVCLSAQTVDDVHFAGTFHVSGMKSLGAPTDPAPPPPVVAPAPPPGNETITPPPPP